MEDNDSDFEEKYTIPESSDEKPSIPESSKVEEPTKVLLPSKSSKFYEGVYNSFMEWRSARSVESFDESVVLAYFEELGKKFKSSTLWTHYSMLRSTLEMHHNVKLEKYCKLRAFLKRKANGYQPKKANTFTSTEIHNFIKRADDKKYLAVKVSLIMGISGLCRCNEMRELKMENVHDLSTELLVKIKDEADWMNNREFKITGDFCKIVKKYIALRPPHATCTSFFLNYQNGHCTNQKIGINKFTSMGKQIAQFLKLPNPDSYSGHTFRRSSATILLEAGVDVSDLKKLGGWKSNVLKYYVDDPIKSNVDVAEQQNAQITPNSQLQSTPQPRVDSNSQPDSSNSTPSNPVQNSVLDNAAQEKFVDMSTPCINLTNCSKFTLNFHSSTD